MVTSTTVWARRPSGHSSSRLWLRRWVAPGVVSVSGWALGLVAGSGGAVSVSGAASSSSVAVRSWVTAVGCSSPPSEPLVSSLIAKPNAAAPITTTAIATASGG